MKYFVLYNLLTVSYHLIVSQIDLNQNVGLRVKKGQINKCNTRISTNLVKNINNDVN